MPLFFRHWAAPPPGARAALQIGDPQASTAAELKEGAEAVARMRMAGAQFEVLLRERRRTFEAAMQGMINADDFDASQHNSVRQRCGPVRRPVRCVCPGGCALVLRA